MTAQKRILVTGITGFIGRRLKEFLTERGFEVWGVSRSGSDDDNVVTGDLLSSSSIDKALSMIPDFRIVIHAAVFAHAIKMESDASALAANETMTENLLRALKDKKGIKFIFLSSVSVYGKDGRGGPVDVEKELAPASNYGISKKRCEEIIRNSGLTDYFILRLAPVYDESRLDNLLKRVYLPGQRKFKLILYPSPSYSLCHVDALLERALDLIQGEGGGSRIMNVADPAPYDQNQLAKKYEGIALPLPVFLMMPLYYLFYLIPGRRGYVLRCFFGKLFKNNIYV